MKNVVGRIKEVIEESKMERGTTSTEICRFRNNGNEFRFWCGGNGTLYFDMKIQNGNPLPNKEVIDQFVFEIFSVRSEKSSDKDWFEKIGYKSRTLSYYWKESSYRYRKERDGNAEEKKN